MNFKARIEIPTGSQYKYEINKETGELVVDRPINQDIPQNYGYIVNTLEKDGDPIDVFVIASQPLVAGCYCNIEVMSGIECLDGGVEDNKIIAKIEGDFVKYERAVLNGIVLYLKSYKKGFKVIREVGKIDAIKMIHAAEFNYAVPGFLNDK